MSKDIAIIGMSCRLPKADNYRKLWGMLEKGISTFGELPESRKKEIEKISDADFPFEYDKGAFLDSIFSFEPELFSISKEEAKYLDPQQRLLIEMTEDAILDSGYNPDELSGKNVGVYIGNTSNIYKQLYNSDDPHEFINGLDASNAARIAYTYNFTGPAFCLDTACSSSVVALNQAINDIRLGKTDEAIVGAASIILLPIKNEAVVTDEIMSDKLETRAFSDDADGFVNGEGGVVLYIKSYNKAIEDNDNIHAVIKGIAVNSNGHRSNGIASPSPNAQAEVIKQAIKDADVDPTMISYVEAHGTATKIGDPIELKGIDSAFSEYNIPRQVIGIGSVKSNFGHTGAVAGLLNVIKVVLMMEHRKTVPSLNFNYPNRYFEFEKSCLYVCTKKADWNGKLIAGVSSFGLTGTNCHVIVEAYDEHNDKPEQKNDKNMIIVSARTRKSLFYMLKRLKEHFLENPDLPIDDIAATLNCGRRHMEYMFCVTVHDLNELIERINEALEDEAHISEKSDLKGKTAFIFCNYDSSENYCYTESTSSDDSILQFFEKEKFLADSLKSFEIKSDIVTGIGAGKIVAGYWKESYSNEKAQEMLKNNEFDNSVSLTAERVNVLLKKYYENGCVRVIVFSPDQTFFDLLKNEADRYGIEIMALNELNDIMDIACKFIASGTRPSINAGKSIYKNRKKIVLPTYFYDRDFYCLDASELIRKNLYQNNDMMLSDSGKTAENENITFDKDYVIGFMDKVFKEVLSNDYSDTQYIYDFSVNSVDVMHCIAIFRKEFHVDIPVVLFYEGNNLGEIKNKILDAVLNGDQKGIYAVKKVPIQSRYELSNAQKRMYALSQLFDNTYAYNNIIPVLITGDINIEKLDSAFRKLLQRNRILRTKYVFEDNDIYQIVVDDVDEGIDVIEMNKAWDSSESTLSLVKYLHLFKLDEAPMMKLTLLKYNNGHSVLISNCHHIASDGFTNNLIIRELLSIYSGRPLQPNEFDYFDFISWQKDFIESEVFKKQEQYWLEMYKDEVQPLDLPTDFPRSEIVTVVGKSSNYTLSKELWKKVKAFIEKESITEYIFFMTVLSLMLRIYTNQKDNVIGSPISGRKYRDFDNTIGLFVNTIAIRNRIDDNSSFHESILKVKNSILSAYENQDYPFELLVDKVVSKRDINRNPLFDVMFAMQNNHMDKTNYMDNVTFEEIEIETSECRFELDIHAFPGEEDVLFRVMYNSGLFKQSTIDTFVERFFKLTEKLIDNSSDAIGSLMFDDICEYSILEGQKNTDIREESILEKFELAASSLPDKTAIVEAGASLTYKEIGKKVDELAAFLYFRLGIRSGDRVAILLENSVDFVASVYAIWKCGAAYVPIDCNYPKDRIKKIVRTSCVSAIIYHSGSIKLVNDLLWENKCLKSTVCLDSYDSAGIDESEENILMNKELWSVVAEQSDDEIMGGGWRNSFTNEFFTKAEMQEYSDNIFLKLKPYLSPDKRVLEIGCASGLTMFRLCEYVAEYVGTDLNTEIIKKDEQIAIDRKINNIRLFDMPAHDIDTIDIGKYDIIIINSVIHCFHGHNYLNKIIRKCISLMKENGIIFIGDVMDLDSKEQFRNELKTYWSLKHSSEKFNEDNIDSKLFVSREYFYNLQGICGEIKEVKCSSKIATIENELTKYRYDVVFTIDKNDPEIRFNCTKNSYDLSDVKQYENMHINSLAVANSAAYVIFTSGTTGEPKGVEISHKNLNNYVDFIINKFSINKNDVSVMLSSMCFDLGYTVLYTTLSCGAELHIVDKQMYLDSQYIYRYINENGITFMKMTPTLLSLYLISSDKNVCPGVRLIFLGGEKLIIKDIKRSRSIFVNSAFVNHYGPTETTVGTSVKELTEYEIENEIFNDSIGKTIDNNIIYICDSDRIVLKGIYGELCVEGAGVSGGYIGADDVTAEKFRYIDCNGELKKVYHTGDYGRLLDNNEIQLKGRIDKQVKVNGYRIELSEIDNCMLEIPEIKNVRSVVDEDENNKYITTYFVSDSIIDINSIKKHLSDRLPEYFVPKKIVQVKEIVMTDNGKIDTKKIKRATSEADNTRTVAYKTDTEKKLSGLWRQILGTDQIGVNDDFFDLGGYSIKAVMLANLIRREFSCEIPLSDVFIYSVFEKMAERIDQITNNNTGDEGYIILNPDKEKTIFAFPPFVAYSAFYFRLSKYLSDYRIISFDFIEENRIESYVEIIKQFSQGGKVSLLGYSLGGSLAMEVCAALEKNDVEVETLVMVDSSKPQGKNLIDVDEVMSVINTEIISETGLSSDEFVQYEGKTRKYLMYYNELLLSEKVKCGIKYICADDNNGKWQKWEELTSADVYMVKGKGTHFKMFDEEYIEYNVSLIKELFCKE
ncbi:condensation domain-containing protein [Ruminococcus flavefaciens]|uniref:condensation domain-containing protein n=1 Tax=Ruminococcus flavefaciens TaxID=1265 RepID=UPI00048B7152|nr:condensation domain-containing protein [Ruminococcus flavefaciens]